MTEKLPTWLRSGPPEGIDRLTSEECAKLERMLWSRCTIVQTPKVSPDQSRNDLVTPTTNYTICALPEGVLCFVEERPELALALAMQIDNLAPSGVSVWPLGNYQYGGFRGSFTSQLRQWLHRDFLLSPLALICAETDMVFIFDEQMRYGLAGINPAISATFFESLGGLDGLGEIMSEYVEDFGVGFGEADREWAKSHLLRQSAQD